MTRRTQRKLVSLIIAACFLLVAIGQQHGWFGAVKQTAVQNQPGLYTVTRFVDGDTIAVDMHGHDETIRMIGVDTPETHKPDAPVQCYGPAASSYVKHLIGTSQVRLEADPESTNRDRYQRLLRYVYLPDGRLVELESIKNGYGFAYTQFPFTKSDQFVAAQQAAKTQVKGLWTNCQPFQLNNGRWQTEDAV
ncbi:MAG TPA: thermonuclease family protein [Candidatus Saccharimonadales bacterium]|nr:thermonuclease family protein [Candidatus Saccharimonadales bacterium]